MHDNKTKLFFDNIIIGAGPAGLAAACFLNRKTIIIDSMPSAGRKLLVSGGGRCNVTHDASPEELAQQFGKHARFTMNAFYDFSSYDIMDFLKENNVETYSDDNGNIFPKSNSSNDVLNAFLNAIKKKNVTFAFQERVCDIILNNENEAIGVKTNRGREIFGKNIILATGGKARPEMGSDGFILEKLNNLGIKISPFIPSLAPLHTKESWCSKISGVSCPNVKVSVKGLPDTTGSILFTHHGVSGPVILPISSHIASLISRTKEDVTIKLSFIADISLNKWVNIFDSWRRPFGTSLIVNKLSEYLPKSLATILCSHAKIPNTEIVAHFNKAMTEELAEACAATKLTIIKAGDWKTAMVTKGGVALSELNADTLECKKIKNLYCVGEMVDVDAPCGGYNISWAISSGVLVARHINTLS